MKTRNVVLGILFAFVAGCAGGVDGDDRDDHGCSISMNSYWSGLTFLLDHNDPRECPQGLDVGDPGTAGATIVEQGVTWPDPPGDAIQVYVTMSEGYSFSIWGPTGSILGSDSELFAWDPDDRWAAEAWSSFTAGESPDFGEFQVVTQSSSAGTRPTAVNTITYWGTQN